MTWRTLRALRLIFVFVVVSGFSRTLFAQTPSKQAVIETSAGTVIVDLAADVAPNQVAYFIQTAQQGGYDGTVFHRAIKNGMVQGGDPLSKDPVETQSVRNRRPQRGEGRARMPRR